MTLAIERFSDAAAAARALAHAVAVELETALARQPRALLLVSGGSSPLIFFEALRMQPLAWERIDISLADERCVAASDEAANASLVRAHLLRDAAAAARWIGLLPDTDAEMEMDTRALAGATPLARAEDAAGRANRNALLAQAAVVVLGVGSDGHTASLFADAPQWPLAQVTPQRYLALQPGAAPHARISLSLSALRQQGHCHVWAIGVEKSRVLDLLQERIATAETQHGRTLAAQSAGPSAPPAWLAQAGAMACLIADPALALTAYCTAEQAT